MVEFTHDTENQRCECKSDKLTTTIHIEKELGGYRFFVIRFEKGNVPAEISGRYSSMKEAQKAVEKYLNNKKQSVAARRKSFGDDYEKRKKVRDAAKSRTEDSQ